MFRKKGVRLLVLLLLSGCQSYDRSAHFLLVNTTDRPIHFWISCDSVVQDVVFKGNNLLRPHDSVLPYLLFGPEGEGPDKNTWVNAINRADDSALHVFYFYIDKKEDPEPKDSLYHLVVKKANYRVDSLEKLNWRIEYR